MKIRWFTLFVVCYLLTATGWWTLLLLRQSDQEYNAIKELSRYNDTSIELIDKEHSKQRLMILSESLFLGFSLVAGIWLIYRGNLKESRSINRQNNFVLAISHELKSPLSSIKLIIDTIKNRNLPQEKIIQLSTTAQEEVIRLEELIQNLLLASKDDEEAFINIEKFTLNNSILDTILEFRSRFPNQEITFINKVNEQIAISGDGKLIALSIKNLIDNAIKYSNSLPITIQLSSETNNVIISVADQGKGVTDEDKPQVFDRFYRAGDEMTRESQGTGLGLFIVRKIMDAHKGEVSVADNSPQGSIFALTIPIL